MCDKFLVGLMVGMLGGAVIVTNSVKVRQMIKDGQQQVKNKFENMTKTSSCCCQDQGVSQ